MKKKVGLFFGTFNPIHVGHLTIANYITEYTPLDQVWFVVTPHSPFKKKNTLLDDHHRYQMVDLAVEHYPKLKASDIEFNLPQPNYTINTLTYLEEKFPEHNFALIMGTDNLRSFHRWKNYDLIIEAHDIYVYPRLTNEKKQTKFEGHARIKHVDAPIMELSSTFIRNAIKDEKNIRPMLPEAVWLYLDEMNFYKQKKAN